MVHARFSEAYIRFALMYTAYHIFKVLTIKDLINKDGDTTTPFKLATGNKLSVSHLYVLFFPFFVQKATAHVGTKELTMCHQSQRGFHDTLVGITQHQKGYLVYIPHRQNIISSYDVFLMRVSLVCWHIHHNHMQKLWICNRMCHTYLILHPQGEKLTI